MSGVESDTYTFPPPGAAPANGTAPRKPGFKRARKQYRLTWADDHEYAGLEVVVNGVPVDKFLELAELADLDVKNPAEYKRINQLFDGFADALVSWNMEDEDGAPWPPTLDSIKAQDLGFVLTIITQWLTAVGGVPGPLGQPSPNGRPSAEQLIPMEPLSARLPS